VTTEGPAGNAAGIHTGRRKRLLSLRENEKMYLKQKGFPLPSLNVSLEDEWELRLARMMTSLKPLMVLQGENGFWKDAIVAFHIIRRKRKNQAIQAAYYFSPSIPLYEDTPMAGITYLSNFEDSTDIRLKAKLKNLVHKGLSQGGVVILGIESKVELEKAHGWVMQDFLPNLQYWKIPENPGKPKLRVSSL
jgi:hypothetical protein